MPAAPALYPTARPDRAEPLAVAGLPSPPNVPIVRLWPFALEEVAAGDRNVTSPFFQGPAVIDYLFLQWDDDNTVPRPTITLTYGPNLPPTGNAVIATIAALGTQVFADGVISVETAGTYQTPIQHLPKWTGGAQTRAFTYELRFPITLDQFQVMVRFGTQAAGAHVVMGHLRVLERVPPELLPNFL